MISGIEGAGCVRLRRGQLDLFFRRRLAAHLQIVAEDLPLGARNALTALPFAADVKQGLGRPAQELAGFDVVVLRSFELATSEMETGSPVVLPTRRPRVPRPAHSFRGGDATAIHHRHG